jgi:hypothetical protein
MRRGFFVSVTVCGVVVAACKGDVELTGEDSRDGGASAPQPEASLTFPGTPTPGSCSGCSEVGLGPSGSLPFDVSSDENEFVAKDSDGALVFNHKASKFSRYLWVADTNLPGVVKIDLDTLKIVGRYITGGSSSSRTTVNAIGEAFIGARTDGNGKAGVTKILPLGKGCPDTHPDGVITTSSGASDVLPWGKDDCVAWHTETDGDIRGLAAQDISATNSNVCKDWQGTSKEFDPKQVTAQDQHYIWVGGTHGKVYKIDAQTGKILIKTEAPLKVYGMALSGDGKLWVGAGGGGFGFIDTTKCVDQASCDAAQICTAACSGNSCPSTCDNAVKASYTGIPGGYGITVDFKKRVWRSGYPDAGLMRYDPQAPTAQRLAYSTTGLAYGGGIAADASGWVWAAKLGTGLVRVNADTMAGMVIPANTKGVAVDSNGRVFAIQYEGAIHLIQPGATLADYQLTKNAVSLMGTAYAYSDMTGVQTRLASGEPAWYRHTFQPCAQAIDWQFLTWDVEVPDGTWAMFNVRVADKQEDLKKSMWFTVACVSPPGGKGYASINSFKGKLMEVEVRFTATGDLNKPSTVKSARVKGFGVLHRCIDVQ